MKRPFLTAAIASAIGSILMPVTLLHAQDDDADEGLDAYEPEEIIVTARKREETLQDVPITLSAFDAADIQAADITNLEIVGELTPGFQFLNQGNQQPGRYNTQLQFRGLTTAQFSPSFATGALFIDGIYVLNGGTSLSLMDIERVEVIKGPQSAYFGRNTFGGAVNLITRDPNMDGFAGEGMITYTSKERVDANFIVEGPIIRDVLSFSVSGRQYVKKGHYTATDGGRLGDEETTAFNGVIKLQATENLSFKLRYGYSEDDDGPPAAAFASGILNDTCTGKVIERPDGTFFPNNYICGQVPSVGQLITDGGVISQNTFLPGYPVSNQGGIPISEWLTAGTDGFSNLPSVSGIGLVRETSRLSFAASYEMNSGHFIDFTYGKNEQYANWIRDFDLSDRDSWFSRDPQSMEDNSYEIRFTSPQDQRLRWLVGYSYYEQDFLSSGGGGDAVTSCFSVVPTPTDDYPGDCLAYTFFALGFANSKQNSDKASVTGIFGSIDFDITDNLTAILEGRFVEDELTKGAGVLTPGAPILKESYDDFLPRFILRWTPSDQTNLYFSYSEAQIAGDFNTFFINADDRERQQYLAIDPRVSESLDAETLEAFEIGIKQRFFDDRLQVNLAWYKYYWENIKGRSSFLINESCRAGDIGSDPACQYEGVQPGDPKSIVNPTTGELEPFFNSRNILLPGDAEITGLELETTWIPSDGFMAQFNYSYIDSEYTDYEFNFVAPIAGYAQMAGNQTPRQPKQSYNLALTKYFDFMSRPAYFRFDYIYQGKAYVDESNLAFIEGYGLMNMRFGVNTDTYMVELFVKNALDETAWQTGARWTDFSSPTQFAYLTAKQGVALSPQDRREFGVRLSYRF